MADPITGYRRAGAISLARSLIAWWALLGGVVLAAVVAVNVLSVAGGVFGTPFPGDFEMTEVGVAVAAFAFLPYCQLYGANVTADIFTAGLSERAIEALSALASLVALGFAVLLFCRMYLGMIDQKVYGYTTAILQFPHWAAFIPILASLALLALAAAITLVESLHLMRRS